MEWVHSTLEHGEPVRVDNIPKVVGVLNSWTGLPKIFFNMMPKLDPRTEGN
jgi:hypothetical protein